MRSLILCLLLANRSFGAELDPAILTSVAPENLKWSGKPGAYQQAIVYGEPSKPGVYIVLAKWPPGTGSRPHSHSTDRLVTVISGTWWVGTGDKYDVDTMVAMKAGSFIRHIADGIHYDQAKDEEVMVQIVGMGPVITKSAGAK